MQLHSQGNADYVYELKKQKETEIKEVNDSDKSEKEKFILIRKIISRFNKLISDGDFSLFLNDDTKE